MESILRQLSGLMNTSKRLFGCSIKLCILAFDVQVNMPEAGVGDGQKGCEPNICGQAAMTRSSQILALSSPSQIEQLHEVCRRSGYRLFGVRTIAAGLKCLDDVSIDLIVSESYLEGECVFDFLKAIKRQKRFATIPFLMLCTNAGVIAKSTSQSMEQIGVLFGADKYLMLETHNSDDLAAEIRALLEREL